MEEMKKKRVRPTLTQVRGLEKELADARESLRLSELENGHLLSDLDGARKRVAALESMFSEKGVAVSELESQIEGTSMLVGDCDAWRDKVRVLVSKLNDSERHVIDLELRCKRLEKQNAELVAENARLVEENGRKKGFFSKLFG